MSQRNPFRRTMPAHRLWLSATAIALALLAMLQASWAVEIKQAPLTSQLQLQPNMVLMFDDSGSMRWNAMPDALSNTNVNEGFISSSVNGVYYNPAITYDPPYTATAKPPLVTTRFPASSYSAAPFDGFISGDGTTNIATYNSGSNPIPTPGSPCATSTRCYYESVNFGRVHPAFTHTFAISIPEAYGYASATCAAGQTPNFGSASNPGTCSRKDTVDPVCPANYTRTGTGTSAVSCQANAGPTPTCDTANGYSLVSGSCRKLTDPTCSTGTRTGTGTTGVACLESQTATCTTTALYTTFQTASTTTASSLQVKGWCRKGSGRDTNNTNTNCNSSSSQSYRNLCFRDEARCSSGFTLNKHAGSGDSSDAACERSGTVIPQCAAGSSPDFSNSANPGKCVQTQTPTCTSPYQLSGSSCVLLPSTTTPTCPAASNPSTPAYTADFADVATPGKCERFLPESPICPTSRFSYTPNLLSDSTGGLINPNTSDVQCRGVAVASFTKYRSMFVYAVKSGDTYTRHYVGAAAEDNSGNGTASLPKAGTCANITSNTVTISNTSETFTNGFPADRCHDDDNIRQNIANWFTYYRTRLLMAKSGLMNAFVDLDEDIRFGFSSINAGTGNSANGANLPTPKTSTSYSQTISNASYAPPISRVKRFGSGVAESRRGEFWNWLSSVTSPGSTPLRAALKATGDYYVSDDQPWTSGTDAPECSGKTGADLSSCGTRLLACRQAYTILVTDGFWNGDSVTLSGNNYSIGGNDYGGDWDAGPGKSTQQIESTAGRCPAGHTFQTIDNDGHTLSGSQKGLCRKGTGKDTSTGTGCSNGSTFRSQCFIDNAFCDAGYTLNKHGSDSTNARCERTVTTTAASVTNTGPNGLSYIYTGLPPYSGGQASNGSSTLADIAMYFWLKDLRSDLANSVPTNSDDPAFWQHMTTFTVGMFGQDAALPDVTPTGTTADAIFAWAKGGTAISDFAWPTPDTGGSSENISDLVHAGLNGRGGFYSAGNPEAFASGVKDAIRRVRDRVGSGASLAANSTKLDTGTTTYQAVYFTGEWKGNLRAFSVNPNDGSISTSPSWEASAQLPAAASRVIKTCANTCTGDGDKINFNTTDATATQRAALGAAAVQDDLINYLRGSAASELRNGGTLRNRSSPLGDIVNSQPVFVGSADPNLFFNKSFPGSDSYFSFTSSSISRKKRIYVAANDGMLHGFSAEQVAENGQPAPGQETFAYMPNAVVLNGVKNLSNPAYGFGVPHQFYNDGELTVSDVYLDGLNGCTGSGCWRTVLIGTTGRGVAKSIYALDVTNPADVKLLWERAASDSSYIGQIIGKPVVAQTASGVWSVLIGNGYNSSHNKPALLQFNIRTGALTVYETTASASNDGLAQPAIWIGNVSENISTEAYAGDLNGNIWKFDLTSPGTSGTKLYTVKDASGNAQPITAGLIAGRNPKVTTESEVWVFFGTGSNLDEFAPSSSVQTWYGLIVKGSNKVVPANTRSNLKQRTIDVQVNSDGSTTLGLRGISSATAGDMVGKKGWYLDLVKPNPDRDHPLAQGERMVTPNQFQGTLLLGTSRVPADSVNFDPCNPSGSGWIMVLDPFTGAPPGSNFFDVNHDGEFNTQDNVGNTGYVTAGVGFSSIPNNPIFVGNTMLISFDNASTGSVNTRGTAGALQRQSWRELVAP